jgi:oligopeptide/dipeptide ABC transporter ATP-binding protein
VPLKVKNLKVKAGKVEILKSVFWKVERGEITALVGESGSGKSISTLSVLKLLPERLKVSGKVEADGLDVLNLEGEELRKFRWEKVSMVFQDPSSALNPLLTIGEQIVEPMIYHKTVKSREEARERAIELLKKCQVPRAEERFNAYPHHLSGGLKQRCAIAMALACNPSYLLADEPTTALDVTVQKRILELLKGLSKNENLGTLLITHDIGVVEEVSDRVFVLYAGYTVEAGKTEEVLKRPMHPYTKGLIECSPKLDGGVKRRLKAIPGSVPEPSEKITGCPFHPRCPKVKEVCRKEVPPVVKEGNRTFRCFFPEA